MTGQRIHRTMEVIPGLPWKAKSPSASRLRKLSIKQGDARGASEVRRRTSSISIVQCPGRPVILVPDPCENGSRYTGVYQLRSHRSRYTVPLATKGPCVQRGRESPRTVTEFVLGGAGNFACSGEQKRHVKLLHIKLFAAAPVTGPPDRVSGQKDLCSLGSEDST